MYQKVDDFLCTKRPCGASVEQTLSAIACGAWRSPLGSAGGATPADPGSRAPLADLRRQQERGALETWQESMKLMHTPSSKSCRRQDSGGGGFLSMPPTNGVAAVAPCQLSVAPVVCPGQSSSGRRRELGAPGAAWIVATRSLRGPSTSGFVAAVVHVRRSDCGQSWSATRTREETLEA